jgi:protein-S-isoprenylcysteine O-methyltransferase Ste14
MFYLKVFGVIFTLLFSFLCAIALILTYPSWWGLAGFVAFLAAAITFIIWVADKEIGL